jgi:hypothetical protein
VEIRWFLIKQRTLTGCVKAYAAAIEGEVITNWIHYVTRCLTVLTSISIALLHYVHKKWARGESTTHDNKSALIAVAGMFPEQRPLETI